MRPEPVAVFQDADAVLVDRAELVADGRHVVVLLLIGPQDRGLEVGHRFVEQAEVAGRRDVVVDDQRQEEQVIGNASADASPAGRVPPVLNVPLLELPGRRAEDLRPGFRRGAVDEGHHVLELVAEAVRPAGLVERRPGPDPARQDLIRQPAVDHQVDGGVRRVNLDGAENAVPEFFHGGQGSPRRAGGGVFRDQPPNVIPRFGLTEDERHFLGLARGECDFRHDGGARIEGRCGTTG